ncbi:MAG: NADH-quinone oxidoreductase subunit NuoH [Longimicrobiales bacterium]|nr:NADH-quinone oxidoreductase subunit NuoH [Longimicrobiales bacterium]
MPIDTSSTAFLVSSVVKIGVVFTLLMLVVAYTTLAERRLSAFIQDRLGPNRVGPFGLLQPIADGIKNVLKEETAPAEANRFYFVVGPMLSIIPALVVFAVIPFAAPLPTPWGVVDMIVADIPIGILYVLALSSVGVYGLVLGAWASNNKYAFLGGLRAAAQMVSYEVALGLSVIAVLLLAGNVTLTEVVAQQQTLDFWFVLPLALAFILFVISAFAETNRLPFDMPEAESELISGYHTEYSAMKFSMFFIAEYGHLVTTSALMATLFLGGWDIPFWTGDDMFWHTCGAAAVGAGMCAAGERILISGFTAEGLPQLADPAWWKTLLTFGAFAAKTGFFVLVYIWVRWTLPRFRYDQVMHLGWKVMLPTALAYVMLVSGTILALDLAGVPYGFTFGLVLTLVSLAATALFLFVVDRDRIISGAAAYERRKKELEQRKAALARVVGAGAGAAVPGSGVAGSGAGAVEAGGAGATD